MHSAPDTLITAAEYLAAEQDAPMRNEFVEGRVYAVAGQSKLHNVLVQNLVLEFDRLADGGACSVYFLEIKVRVEACNAYYYPDVVLTCDAGDDDPSVVHRPCLIAEVMSEDTESMDRREKLIAYRTLPSLTEYVLVDSRRSRIEVYRRDSDGWIHEILEPGDSLHTSCLNASIPFETIYEGVSLPSRIEEDLPEYA